MFLDPMGSGQPGFSTGYLYGCAVFFALLVVEFVVGLGAGAYRHRAPSLRFFPMYISDIKAAFDLVGA